MVQEVLAEEGVTPAEITHLSVCTGPGSFTGLRVALAFAKGFALPRGLPVIGISALEVLAAQVDPDKEKRIVSVMDVRRSEVCWAVYDMGHCVQAPVTQKIDIAKTSIAKQDYDCLTGDGAHLVGQSSEFTVVSGKALAWLDPAIPLYSRGPDAKLPGGVDPI